MLDLDNFKEINDHYGHAVGDQVLYTIAQRCRASIRQVDILGRYGGDEFAILLPSAELEEAFEIAERVRQAVTQSAVSTQFGNVSLSMSLGVAQASPNMASLRTLLARADAALYRPRKMGATRSCRTVKMFLRFNDVNIGEVQHAASSSPDIPSKT